MTDRVLVQNCADHDGCHVHTLIKDRHVAYQADDAGDLQEIVLTDVVMWTSHASSVFHSSCRIGRGGDWDGLRVEDHRDAAPGELSEAPGSVSWRPICQSCHDLAGHNEPKHPTGGARRRVDGTIVVHDSHPAYEQLAAAGHETHQGASFTDCERCSELAGNCDGCRASLEAG